MRLCVDPASESMEIGSPIVNIQTSLKISNGSSVVIFTSDSIIPKINARTTPPPPPPPPPSPSHHRFLFL